MGVGRVATKSEGSGAKTLVVLTGMTRDSGTMDVNNTGVVTVLVVEKITPDPPCDLGILLLDHDPTPMGDPGPIGLKPSHESPEKEYGTDPCLPYNDRGSTTHDPKG